ncbi:MAG: hypothetical protein IKK40_07255, partial [Bacteroidales bacterium]|nr:hypothetical protein [Bacteroidales bacterium]
EYKKIIDMVSILIDGKQICRNLPILPFMTSQPYGTRKHRWEDVALEVNLNVNFSEIKIDFVKNSLSKVNANDFNIVFVCSDKTIDEAMGYEFVETRKIKLKGKYFDTAREARTYLQNKFREAHAQWEIDHQAWADNEQAWADYETAHQEWEEGGEQGEEPQPPETPRYDEPIEPEEPIAPSVEPYDEPVNPYTEGYELEIPVGSGNMYKDSDYRLLYEQMDNSQVAFGVEQALQFDGIVEKMFAFSIFSVAPKYNDSWLEQFERVVNSDIHYNMSLSGTEGEILPPNTDVCLYSATEKISWRKALLDFEGNVKKSLLITLNKNDDELATEKDLEYANVDLYLCLIYRKLS